MMKKLVLAILAIITFFTSSYAIAEGKLTTLKTENRTDAPFEYFYAKVMNTGDEEIAFGTGTLICAFDDKKPPLTEEYVGPSGGWGCVVLKPGEYAYVSHMVWPDDYIAEYKYTPEESLSLPVYEILNLPCDVQFEKNKNDYSGYVSITLTNTTDRMLCDIFVQIAFLQDWDGSMLCVENHECEGNLYIHPGSTVTVKVYIDNALGKFVHVYNGAPISPKYMDVRIMSMENDKYSIK